MNLPPTPGMSNDDTAPTTRPPQWRDPDGGVVLSHAETLFDAPATPGELVSNGWMQVDGFALTTHLGRRVIQGCKSRDFRDGWRKNPDTGAVSPRVYPSRTLLD